jgi:glycosyltransferase involved in cell wall biosynthesis
MKILFLSAWYPHRNDPMSGLFVRKHAEAVALFCEVTVLYVHHDNEINEFEIVTNKNGNLNEIIVYYPCKKNIIFYKLRKIINYLIAFLKGFEVLKQNKFEPYIIHANVLTRTGLIALITSKIKKIPYVVTEHWTRYLPEHNEFNGFFHKWITRIVVRKARAIFPVSKLLKNAMIKHNLLNNNYLIIDNVIDPVFSFTFPIEPRTKKRMILVSCFDELQKNVKGIIRVIYNLSQTRDDFELVIIGNGVDFNEILNMSNNLNLTNKFVFFHGEKTSYDVANSIFNSDFMLIFSNYETASIVITESLALGKPVLSTRVGIALDFIDNQCGILVNIGDEVAFFENMNYMLDNIFNFDTTVIKKKFENRFTYETIGKKIFMVYKSVVNKSF